MKRWYKEFHQNKEKYCFDFYRECRDCVAIIEEVDEPKKGLFKAKLVEIIPLNEFKVIGCLHDPQYQLNNEFLLRNHHKPRTSYAIGTFDNIYWFDVRFPGQKFAEEWILLTNERYKYFKDKINESR